jgi:hypothetical protein
LLVCGWMGAIGGRLARRRNAVACHGRWVLALLTLVVCLLGAGASSAAASSSLSWSQPFLISHQPPWTFPAYGSNPPEPIADWSSVKMSCPSSSLCVAVDGYGNVVTSTDPTGGTSKWTAVAIDNFALNDISCASTTLCVAVDQNGDVLTSTNPTGGAGAWAVTKIDTHFAAYLVGVSCVPGQALCVAIDPFGNAFSSNDPSGGAGAWSKSGTDDFLSSISCPSTSLCVAEGGDGSGKGDIVTTTDPGGASPSWALPQEVATRGFTGNISCSSSSLCVAAASPDSGSTGNLLVSTNPTGGPTAWTATSLPNPLGAVTCASDSLCLAMDYNGAIWSSTNPTGGASAWSSTANDLTDPYEGPVVYDDLACASTSMCLALTGGAAASATAPTGGTSAWTDELIDDTDSLTAASCPSSSFCASVDSLGNVATSTNPAGGAGAWSATNIISDSLIGPLGLDGISCASSSLCVAVRGPSYDEIYTSSDPTGGSTAWSGPTQLSTSGVPDAVSCAPTTTFCAVLDSSGQLFTSTNPTGGASAWTATDLSGLSVGSPRTMSCPSSSLCVGTSLNGIVYSTDPTGGASAWNSFTLGAGDLGQVSCASATLCVALEGYGSQVWTSADPTAGASSWTQTAASTIDPNTGSFSGVSCSTGGLCALIASQGSGSGDIAMSSNPAAGASAWSVSQGAISTIGGLGGTGTLGVACGGTSLCLAIDPRGDAYAGTPPQAPTNSAPPTISGTAQQGQRLTESHGSWSNSPTSYSYQWEECDSSGGSCSAISGATSQTYTLTAGDVGHRIRVRESASNAGGSSSPATSDATAAVKLPPAPTNTAPPTISGTAREGQRLTESHGSWSNSPTGYSYQWEDCNSSGGSCSAISGATSRTYTLTAGDVGHRIRVRETANNAGGSSSPATSGATAVTLPPRPTVTKLSPNKGPAGTIVTITGRYFSVTSTVHFASAKAKIYKFVSATEIKVTAPQGSGTVNVTVTTSGVTSADTSFDRYTY